VWSILISKKIENALSDSIILRLALLTKKTSFCSLE